MKPWDDPDLRDYMRALRRDPCAYCGGPGGTVDHVVAKALGGRKWDPLNLTGACEPCNRRKDRGKDGGHRTLLETLLARREQQRQYLRRAILASLTPGMAIRTPWGEAGEVSRVEGEAVYAWIPDQQREWRGANPLALRDSLGVRLADRLRMGA